MRDTLILRLVSAIFRRRTAWPDNSPDGLLLHCYGSLKQRYIARIASEQTYNTAIAMRLRANGGIMMHCIKSSE
jgi:hypothetical protein